MLHAAMLPLRICPGIIVYIPYVLQCIVFYPGEMSYGWGILVLR